MRHDDPAAAGSRRPKGTAGFYVVAVAATMVSIDTSWHFFGSVFHIDNKAERAAMFAVLEMALVACGVAMRANVRRPPWRPGPARMLAWALCGLSAYMAVALSGLTEGLARVALGPALALVALHLALGIEIRVKQGADTGTWAKVRAELRERLLSRMGLGNDERDAAQRSRDRALRQAARLAAGHGHGIRRQARLAKAVHVSGAAESAQRRAALIEQTAALRNLADLRRLDLPSPWTGQAGGRHADGRNGQAAEARRSPVPRGASKGRTDTGTAIRRLRERYPEMSTVDIAKRVGTTDRTVRRHLNGSSSAAQPDLA
jgi:hypothetical protein